MNKRFQFISLIFLLLISIDAVGQVEDTVIVILHPMLGEEIDQREKQELDLFDMIPDREYRSGYFYMLADSTIYLHITTRTGKELNLPYNWENFENLKSQIGGKSLVAPNLLTLQDSIKEKTYILIELYTGGNVMGRLLEIGEEYLVVDSESGEIKVRKSQIKKISIVDNFMVRNGKLWFPNPNDTRYLFGPTAYPLGKGEGYYQNVYVLFNAGFIGVSDVLDLGGGLELISTLSGNPILFFSGKLGFEVADKVHLGPGVFLGTFLNSSDTEVFGILYGVGTLGSREDNLSLGLGYGFIGEGFSERPVITLSGMKRVSRRLSLVSENWMIPFDGYYGAFSVGVRLMGEKTTFDLALLRTSEWEAGILAVPFLGFVYKF